MIEAPIQPEGAIEHADATYVGQPPEIVRCIYTSIKERSIRYWSPVPKMIQLVEERLVMRARKPHRR
jgi:hypothetical protein